MEKIKMGNFYLFKKCFFLILKSEKYSNIFHGDRLTLAILVGWICWANNFSWPYYKPLHLVLSQKSYDDVQ